MGLILIGCGGEETDECDLDDAEPVEVCERAECDDLDACADLDPPEIRLTSPSTTESSDYELAGEIEHHGKLESATYRLGEESARELDVQDGGFDEQIELEEGDNELEVTATDQWGNEGHLQTTIRYEEQVEELRANFSVSGSLEVGQPVRFDASSTTLPSEVDAEYHWDFEEHGTGSGERRHETFEEAGVYIVTLTVMTDDGQESVHIDNVEITDPDAPSETGALEGIVFDDEGAPVEAAQLNVVGRDARAETSPSGRFELDDLPVDTDLALRLDHPDYVTKAETVRIPSERGESFVRFELTAPEPPTEPSDDPSGNDTLETDDGLTVEVGEEALVDADGEVAEGPIEVVVTPLDLAEDAGLLPGGSAGLSTEGDTLDVQAGGAVHVAFYQDGEELSVAPGHTVRVDIPLTVGIAAPGDTIMAFELDRGSALWKERDEIELDEAGEETMGEAIATTQMDRTGWWMIGQELPETDTLTTGCVWPDEGASNDGGDGDAGQDDPDAGQDDAGGEAPNSEELCWMEATADGWRDGFDVRGDQTHAFEPPSEGEVCLEATARGGLCTGERCIDDEDDWPQEALVELDCLNDQAEPIGWDESVDVVFDEDTGTHVFSFDGEAGDGAIFRLRQEYFQEFAGQIELFAATGTRLASESFDEEDAAVAAVLPDDGQYLGVVEADDDATGEGTVELLSREVVEPGEIIEGELAGGEFDDYLVDAGDERLLNAAALGETESTTYADLTFYDLLGSPYDPVDVHDVPETGPVEVDDRSFHQLRVENPRSFSGPEDHEVQVVAVDPEPAEVSFDSRGEATHDGRLDRYGERRYVEFDASEGDGLYLELAGRGDVSQRAYDLGMRIWRKGDGETWEGEEELYALGRDPGVLGAIDAFQTRIEESGTYVIEVFAEGTDLNKTEPGAFELHFERASADSQITVGDEDCSDADTNSLNAALRAVEEDGTVTVCEGTYDSLIPGRIDRDGVTVEGAGVDQTTLSYKHPMYRDDGRRIIDLDARHVTLEDFTMLYELPAEMRDNGGAFISTAGSDRSDPARGLRVRNLDMETDSVGRPVNRGLSLLGSGSTDVKIEHTSIEGVGTGYRARGEDYTLEDVTIDSRDSSVWVQSKDLNTDPSNGMTIKESDINSEGRGLYLGNMRDVTIEGNSIETGGDDPIYLGLDRGGPSTTVIRDNELRSSESSEPLQVTQYSRSDGETREVLIADNDIASRDRATTYGAIHLTNRSETTDMEVRGNVVDAQDGRGLHATADDHDAGELRVVNNVFRETQDRYSGLRLRDAELWEEIEFVNNSVRSVSTASGLDGHIGLVVHLYDSSYSGELPLTLQNNIFEGPRDESTQKQTGVLFPEESDVSIDNDFNLLSGYDEAYGGGDVSEGADDLIDEAPEFDNDDLELDASSPAIDAGSCQVAPDADRLGVSRPQGDGCDMGAYEQ